MSNQITFVQGQEKSYSEEVLEHLLNEYSKNEYPMKDRPTEVKIGVYLNSIPINYHDMNFEATFYLRQAWKDWRLAFDPRYNVHKIRAPAEIIKTKFFLPDLFSR